MKIVVDLAEVHSGAGHLLADVARALARACADSDGAAQLYLLLSDARPETILPLRAVFDGLVPQKRIRVWASRALPVAEASGASPPPWAALIRQAVIADMAPAVVISAATGDGACGPARIVGRVHDDPPRLVLHASGSAEVTEVIDLATAPERRGVEVSPAFAREVLACLHRHLHDSLPPADLPDGRPRLAFVSPLLPEQSGIAVYAHDLLPELARWYSIDVVADQAVVTDPWVRDHARVIDPAEFLRQSRNYARVLYQMGNSGLHRFMFPLMERVPGVMMLHDFYLGHALQACGPALLRQALWDSHGTAAALCEKAEGAEVAMSRFPANLPVLQQARGVMVHSSHARSLASAWYGPGAGEDWAVVPILRRATPVDEVTRLAARAALGLPSDGLLICSFGIIGLSKLCHLIIEAFTTAELSRGTKACLVLVGRNDTGRYGRDLTAAIAASGLGDRIRITGWTDDALYSRYLQAADIAVQLRAGSRGETSAAVLDCMAHGVATVVNAHGSLANLDRASVMLLPDEVTVPELVEALDSLATDTSRRAALGSAALSIIARDHAPEVCANAYAEAIEQYWRADVSGQNVLNRLARTDPAHREATAAALAWNLPPEPRPRQLLVDVSAITETDLRTGVQRVVRSILAEWLARPPSGWMVRPVRGEKTVQGFRYAQRWTEAFLGLGDPCLPDAPVDVWPGDIFLGLDLNGIVPVVNQPLLDAWHRKGVDVRFVVYDLLPVRLPQYFPAPEIPNFLRWLTTIARYGGAACISRSVAVDLQDWLAQNTDSPPPPFRIDSFRLGADIETSAPTGGMPPGGRAALQMIGAGTTFLMVGTVEPRKGHAQALSAFEVLWQDRAADACLVIAGKQGWQVEDLCDRLRHHPEMGHRLFWFDGPSDAFLARAYAAASCLLMASEGEGFGLPLIEAARVGLPILARNLPEFREVAGDHAAYFTGKSPDDLAQALRSWIGLHAAGRHPQSRGMPVATWSESAADLARALGIDPWPGPGTAMGSVHKTDPGGAA